MSAKLRFNPDKSLVEIELPDGQVLDPMETPAAEDDDPIVMLVDEEDENAPSHLAVIGEYPGLRTQTVYQLIPVETSVEFDVDLDEEDEEEEETTA